MWTLTLVKLCDFSNIQGYGGWCSRALLWTRLLSERNSSLGRGDFVCQLWPAYAGRKCCAARAEAFVTQRLRHLECDGCTIAKLQPGGCSFCIRAVGVLVKVTQAILSPFVARVCTFDHGTTFQVAAAAVAPRSCCVAARCAGSRSASQLVALWAHDPDEVNHSRSVRS